MKFLIIACLLAAAAALDEKISDSEEKACIGDYFEGGNLTSKCENAIKDLDKELFAFIVGDITFDWTLNCIKENMKDYKFLDFFLHVKYEQETETTSVPVQLQQLSIRDAARSICTRSHQFDSLFEQVLTEMKFNRRDPEYQCLFKYSIEKKIIMKSDFDLDTSDFDSVNCTTYFKQFDDEFTTTSSQKEPSRSKFDDCVDSKNENFNFLRNMKIVMAIGMFDLSEKQAEKFKEVYKEWFTGGDRFIMECVRDVYKKSE